VPSRESDIPILTHEGTAAGVFKDVAYNVGSAIAIKIARIAAVYVTLWHVVDWIGRCAPWDDVPAIACSKADIPAACFVVAGDIGNSVAVEVGYYAVGSRRTRSLNGSPRGACRECQVPQTRAVARTSQVCTTISIEVCDKTGERDDDRREWTIPGRQGHSSHPRRSRRQRIGRSRL